jgi:hypothetical protein
MIPINIDYKMSPFHVWFIFILYNLFTVSMKEFNLYGILYAMFSLDYRVLLIALNTVGLYLFLRHAKIDFTARISMNETK